MKGAKLLRRSRTRISRYERVKLVGLAGRGVEMECTKENWSSRKGSIAMDLALGVIGETKGVLIDYGMVGDTALKRETFVCVVPRWRRK